MNTKQDFTPAKRVPLSDSERCRYEWQTWIGELGEGGQERLKGATVLVSRCGGVGGMVAYELAAAGVGHLVLAHAGNLRLDDLNRQLLMSHAGIGQPRVEVAAARLRAFNPDIQITTVAENISASNADRLVERADIVASCAPLFEERLLMNAAAVGQGKPLVDCAMYELHGQVTTVLPRQSPCLACLYPEAPPAWNRQFPVLGAVSGTVGCLGALEVIKLITGIGEPLAGKMLLCDLRLMDFRKVLMQKNPACAVCGTS
jgi:molybdopterin/thiamine biosynthesis adenylyltransferase